MNFFLKFFRILPPELAHRLALDSLNFIYKIGILNLFYKKPELETFSFAGMNFRNRLGTAAGLDKNGDYIDCLGELGFGFLEVGTVTPIEQYGNSKPRVFRNFQDESIINRLGFNNKGVDHLVKNLKSRSFKGIVGVNVGANKKSKGEQRVKDYLYCIEKVYKYADYITVNISSPNTPNLRDLHNMDNLSDLVLSIEDKVKELNIDIPFFLKISPDETNDSIDNIIKTVESSFFQGIIATNTTIDKTNLSNKKFNNIDGGLSGRPLMDRSTETIKAIKSKSDKEIPVIGVGGVMNAADFNKKIDAGSELVQIYTGFVIKGPNILSDILKKDD
ncbi:MAG: quinone-dependent dihydroorotate dehydrogenase [Gammaproteobacteria bacterium]